MSAPYTVSMSDDGLTASLLDPGGYRVSIQDACETINQQNTDIDRNIQAIESDYADTETLRARVVELEAALKNLLDAHDAYYRLPADYNDFQKRKVTLNRAVERSRAELTASPAPAPKTAPETPTLTQYARRIVATIEAKKRDEREGKL